MTNLNRIALALLLVCCLALVAAVHAPSEATTLEMEQPPVQITLRKVEESRRVTLVEDDDGHFDFNKPGLVLTYSMTVPEGLTVHEVTQPQEVQAKDSAGTDISRIEAGFRNEREYVKLEQSWGEPPTGFTFRLLPATRKAATFDLQATFHLEAYGGTESISFEPTGQWQAVDASALELDQLEIRLGDGGFGQDSAALSIRPGTAREAIHEIYLIDGDEEIKSMGSMWTDREAAFSFDHPYREGQRVRIVARTQVQSIPITIDLREQPLP